MPLRIIETDSTGVVTQSYAPGGNRGLYKRNGGIENMAYKYTGWLSIRAAKKVLMEMFLPTGYPASVAPDYTRYQIYDSLQAFSSSIAGLLASRAVLEGFGVGNADASSTNAVLLTISQEVTSRIATILFAWRLGPSLSSSCKSYRFLADILNDSALLLDTLSPSLPPGPTAPRIITLCLSGTLRALCGVAAGGSKAALSVHFAKNGNVGELNAKDAAQETIIGLLGMLAGSYVIRHLSGRFITWISLFALLAVHLVTNYLAVRSVVMTSLNRQRLSLVYAEWLRSRKCLTPDEVSRLEHIFDFGGNFALSPSTRPRYRPLNCYIYEDGSKLGRMVSEGRVEVVEDLARLFGAEKYILLPPSDSGKDPICIYMKRGWTHRDVLKACFHGLKLSADIHEALSRVGRSGLAAHQVLALTTTSLREADDTVIALLEQLPDNGWDMQENCILTESIGTVDIELLENKDK